MRPTSTVESHATGARKVMLLETSAVNSLLRQDISTAEQHLVCGLEECVMGLEEESYCAADAGRQDGPRSQFSLVPVWRSWVSEDHELGNGCIQTSAT